MDKWDHLVVVIPGIGGTVLAEPGPDGTVLAVPGPNGTVLAVPGPNGTVLAVPGPNGRPGKTVWSASVPGVSLLFRPHLLSLDRYPRLLPVGLIRTRRLFGLWTALNGYDGLLRRLGTMSGVVVDDGTPQGRNLHANVVAFGYDFRLGVADTCGRAS